MSLKFSNRVQVGSKLIHTPSGKVYRIVSKLASKDDTIVRLADLQGKLVSRPVIFRHKADDENEEKQQSPSINVSGVADLLSGSGGEAAAGAASGAEAAGGLASAAEAIAPLALLASADGANADAAYADGYKSGKTDFSSGREFLQVNRNPGTSEFSRNYCDGYQDGYANLRPRRSVKQAAQWEVPKCKSCGNNKQPQECPGCKNKYCSECVIDHHANNPAHNRVAAKKEKGI